MRVVWVDVFAVRQWGGNGAGEVVSFFSDFLLSPVLPSLFINPSDLDFRGVMEGCVGAVVVSPPLKGTLALKKSWEERYAEKDKRNFLESPEYAAARKELPFCRLWYVKTFS